VWPGSTCTAGTTPDPGANPPRYPLRVRRAGTSRPPAVTNVAPGYPLSVHVTDAVLWKRNTTPTWPRPAPPPPAVTEIWPEAHAAEAAWADAPPAPLDVALAVLVVVIVAVAVDVEVEAGVEAEAEVEADVGGVDDEPQPTSARIPARQGTRRLTCRWRSSAARGFPANG
jgi:hypothetical protein